VKKLKNLEIETVATQLVINFEKEHGRSILKNKQKGCGWDLCTSDGNEIRYIEIKSTTGKKLTGRWIEKAGHEHLKNNLNFWIYAVVNCKENGEGRIITLNHQQLKKVEIVEETKYIMKFAKETFL
jgi:hypothetical protein